VNARPSFESARHVSACVVPNRLKSVALTLAVAGVLAPSAHAQWAGRNVVRPAVLAEIPHDTAAFTQGLLWLDGFLYESTGLYGQSSIRALKPTTGAVLRRAPVPGRYFAEGLAWYRGEFLQLTWQEGEALRWRKDFSGGAGKASGHSGALRYAGEGWGLATLVTGRDTALWMSNGSDTLYRRVVKDGQLRVAGKVAVHWNGRPLARLNELEGARGKIVANVWYSDSLFVIDPRDGRVVAVVDGAELAARSGRRSFHDVLNGVAWDPVKDEFYVPGEDPRILMIGPGSRNVRGVTRALPRPFLVSCAGNKPPVPGVFRDFRADFHRRAPTTYF
jgi:glutamine cyclotransferase